MGNSTNKKINTTKKPKGSAPQGGIDIKEIKIDRNLMPKKTNEMCFEIVVIKIDNKGKITASDSLEKLYDKAFIFYEKPINISAARLVRDKLAENNISEILDYSDNNIKIEEAVNAKIQEWEKAHPEQESLKLKSGTYIQLPTDINKDDPVNLYASAMTGKMGQLLLKLNTLANSFARALKEQYDSKDSTPDPNDLAQKFSKANKQQTESGNFSIKDLKNKIQNMLARRGKADEPHLHQSPAPRLPKILLIGDSGVGKSLIANFIHFKVKERLKEFYGEGIPSRPVRIGIPEFVGKEDDFEYRLFGYAAGAFTGAKENGSLGLLLGNLGQVIFLDEIGAANYEIQSKLLAYLDDYQVRPRGWEDDSFFCPTLIVAATNEKDKLNDNNQFRNDLLARFTDRLEIPNIKERIQEKEDNLLYLLDCLLQTEDINPKGTVEKIGKEAFNALYSCFSHGCVGNFRTLENVMREACKRVIDDKRNYMVKADVKEVLEAMNIQSGQTPPTGNTSETITPSEKEIENFIDKNKGLRGIAPNIKTEIIDQMKNDKGKGYGRIFNEIKQQHPGEIKDENRSSIQRFVDSAKKELFHDK